MIEDIDIDEKAIKKIHINGGDSRKTLYRHLLNTGAMPIFMGTKKPAEIELIYIQFLRFRQTFKTLDKEQATAFTKKLIELFNESQCLEKAIIKETREHRYGLIFQAMTKEIEKIKPNDK